MQVTLFSSKTVGGYHLQSYIKLWILSACKYNDVFHYMYDQTAHAIHSIISS